MPTEDLVKLKKEHRKMYNPKGLLDVTKQWSGEITFEFKPKYGRIKTDKEGRIIKVPKVSKTGRPIIQYKDENGRWSDKPTETDKVGQRR